MNFKNWLLNEVWFSKGKAQNSLMKPGPRDLKHKPSDVKLCGMGGGPGPGGACASGGTGSPKMMKKEDVDPRVGSTCPHCGSKETIGARSVEKDKNGKFKAFANAHCHSCDNGFGFKF